MNVKQMTLKQKTRKVWHDIYYARTPERRLSFALRCQNVAERIDLKPKSTTTIDQFRFYLHLSLCQACADYNNVSLSLKNAVMTLVNSEKLSEQVTKLNKSLIKKYSK